MNEFIETGKRHRMESSRSRSEGKGSFQGIKRQMEAQLAMKKREVVKRERTSCTLVLGEQWHGWGQTLWRKKTTRMEG
jgi:hypothetical protein